MRIKKYRIRKGLSQCELAKTIGLTQKAVSKWEVGAARPNAKYLPTLAATLGCTIDELFEDEGGTKEH